jgi:hypothetical protein
MYSSYFPSAGLKFTIGVNFFKGDVTLARRQMDAAKKQLPPASIEQFEIGNEVGGPHAQAPVHMQ